MNYALASHSLTLYHVNITQIDKQHHFNQNYKNLTIKEDFILTIFNKNLENEDLAVLLAFNPTENYRAWTTDWEKMKTTNPWVLYEAS